MKNWDKSNLYMRGFPSIGQRVSTGEGLDPYEDSDTASEFSSGSNDRWEPQRILTLEGNGPQGLFILYVLEALMDEVAWLEKRSSPPAFSSTSSPALHTGQSKINYGVYERRQ